MSKSILVHLKTKWVYLLLAVFAGAVLATVLVQGLSAEQLFGLALLPWQIALIYLCCIAGGALFAVREKQAEPEVKAAAANIEGAAQAQSE